jgi:ACS family tartrate transporter-like MFS transporter
VLAAFANPRVLLIGAIGFLLIGAITTFILSAPMILRALPAWTQSRSDMWSASVVWWGLSSCCWPEIMLTGMAIGFEFLLVYGCAGRVVSRAEHAISAHGCDRRLYGFCGLLLCHPHADVFRLGGSASCPRTRRRCAAINTMSQIGAFVTPYAWGVAKDATGGFQAGLFGLLVMTLMLGALTLLLRRR